MTPPKGVIRFAEIELDLDRSSLSSRGEEIRAEPKVIALIQLLLDHNGRNVTTEELLVGVWPDAATTPGSLARAVSLARKAIHGHSQVAASKIIQTVRGVGYRIGVPIEFIEGASEPAPSSAFIGREVVLQRTQGVLERLSEERSGLIMVGGEPGIGKTRLSEEIARSARACRIEVLSGHCREDGGGPAYAPWTELLRSHTADRGLTRVRAEAGHDCEALANILPELGETENRPGLLGSTGSERSLQLAAVERLLVRAARSRPILLILEDIHIADEASQFLLRGLAEVTAGHAIGILVTYRIAELADSPIAAKTLVDLAQSAPERVDVQLEGLSPEETREFVEHRGESNWSDREIERLHERSDGSPFFIQELIRHREERGERNLPESTRLLLRSRFEGLSEEVQNLLQVASVIGREFQLSDLSHALDQSVAQTASRLGDAEERRLIEPVSEIASSFRFSHALVREAIYDGLRSDERCRLHDVVGTSLVTLYGEADHPPLDDLARHFAKAGSHDQALFYSISAAERSRRHLAFEKAAASLRQALQVMSAIPPVDQTQQAELLLLLGDVLFRAGNAAEAKETVLRAIEIARHIGAVKSFAEGACTLALWRQDNIGVVPTERLSLLEEALRMLPKEDSALRARVLTGLSADLYWSDSFDRSAALSREAIEVARRVNDASTTFVALYQRFDLLLGPEHGEEVDEVNAECLTLAKELRNLEYEFLARKRIWERHVIKAEPIEVDQVLGDCVKLSDRLREPRFTEAVEVMGAARELWRGELPAASARLPDPETVDLKQTSSMIHSIMLMPRLFLLLRMQGRLEALERVARAGVETFPHLYGLRGGLSLFYSLTGRPEEAHTLLRELARNDFADLRPDANLAINLAVLSETIAKVNDRKLADGLIDRIRPFAGSHMITGTYMSLGSADRYLGLLSTTRRRFDEAEKHFEAALEIETRMGAAPWRAWAERDFAEMLVRRDDGVIGPEAEKRFERADQIEASIRAQ